MSTDRDDQRMRLDKWLWCARFFKTRSMAAAAVQGGKVHVNGMRVKPGRAVCLGDQLKVSRGVEIMEVIVADCSARRGPAGEAQRLYLETEQSVQQRQQQVDQRRMEAVSSLGSTAGRPSKRQRRQLLRFRGR